MRHPPVRTIHTAVAMSADACLQVVMEALQKFLQHGLGPAHVGDALTAVTSRCEELLQLYIRSTEDPTLGQASLAKAQADRAVLSKALSVAMRSFEAGSKLARLTDCCDIEKVEKQCQVRLALGAPASRKAFATLAVLQSYVVVMRHMGACGTTA